MAETDNARSQIDRSRERIGEIAEELTRRVSPEHLKRRAKEATVRKTQEWKERVVASPTALGLLGGICGAIAGSLLGRAARERQYDTRWEGDYVASSELRPSGRISVERYDVSPPIYETSIGYAGEIYGREDESHAGKLGAVKEKAAGAVEGLKEKVGDAVGGAKAKSEDIAHGVREKVEHARERVSHAKERMSHARERVPSRYEMKHQASTWAHEQPIILGIGALALGALAGSLIPVSQREQRALSQVKGQLDEKLASAKGQLQEKMSSVSSSLGDKLGGEQSQEATSASSGSFGNLREGNVGSAGIENEGSGAILNSDDDHSPPIH